MVPWLMLGPYVVVMTTLALFGAFVDPREV